MLNGFESLVAATALFVCGHLAQSSEGLRATLIERLGEGPFRGLYSVFAAVGLVWMVVAYRRAPEIVLWSPRDGLRWAPLLLMPFASILFVAANSTKSPTKVGAAPVPGEVAAVAGIIRVTRHPLMWAFILWGLGHLLVTGDWANLIMVGGIVVLAVGGMLHIDRRRERQFGAAWGPIALSTSVLPFGAILSGRAKFDWPGIGWARVLGGLALYLVLLFGHDFVIGVSALP